MKVDFRRMGVGLTSLACALGALLMPSQAKADLGLKTEYTLILLDGSGTMLDFSRILNGESVNKWKEGLLRAKTAVEEQRDGRFLMSNDPNWDPELAAQSGPANTINVARTNNCYAIWKFGDNSFDRLYPPASAGVEYKCADQTTEASRLAVYNEVISLLTTLSEPANTGIMTPLAAGMCDSLERLRAVGTANDFRTLILESDGLENNSQGHVCHGSYSNVAYDRNAVNPNNSDYRAWAGGTDEGSWQWNVYTFAVFNGWYGGQMASDPNFLANFVVTEEPWEDPNRLGIKTSETWLDYYMNAYGPLGETLAREYSRMVTMHIDALYDFIPAGSSANYAAGGPDDPLKAFMRSMSESTKGRFQKIVYNGDLASRPGYNHPWPGDVDDSDCVSTADLNHVKQELNRPVSDSQHAARVDANRDGWVNAADVALVLKNRGCGYCQGRTGPYVPCKVQIN